MRNFLSIEGVQLTEEQRKIYHLNPNVVVSGCAGSGKTLLALMVAIRMKNEGNSVALIVFTKALRTFIKDSLSLAKQKDINVFYGDDKGLEPEKFDIVVIDEFQDFTLPEVEGFILKVRKGAYVFGDDMQRFYGDTNRGKSLATFDQIVSRFKLSPHHLNVSYRIPGKNLGLINSVNRENPLATKRDSEDLGTLPQIIKFSSYQAELAWLSKFLNSNTQFENVGILFKQNQTQHNGYFFEKRVMEDHIPGIEEVMNYLVENGLSVGYKIGGSDHLDFSGKVTVNLMTIHSSKGIEFDCVIIPFNGHTNKNFDIKMPYVAYTRSSNKLIITYSVCASGELKNVQRDAYFGDGIRISRKSDWNNEVFMLTNFPEKTVELHAFLNNRPDLLEGYKAFKKHTSFYGWDL